MRSATKVCNINIHYLANTRSVNSCILIVQVVTMKVLCLVTLLHVVASQIIEPGNIFGTWTALEVYFDEEPERLKSLDNCIKFHLSYGAGDCECFDRHLPIFDATTTFRNMSFDVSIYFVKSYREAINISSIIQDRDRCECRNTVMGRVISNNYLVIYYDLEANVRTSVSLNVVLYAKSVPTVPNIIEELEASNEEMYNRKHAVLCSVINRQFYFA